MNSRSRGLTLGAAIASVFFLAGCPATINVSYLTYSGTDEPEPDLKGRPKFKLASPMILVDMKKDEKTSVVSMGFKTIPVDEPGGPTYAVVAEDMPGVTSKIGVAARPNSMLVHDVTTDIEDKRVELIKDVGGILVSALGAGAADRPVPPLDFKAVLDLATALRTHKVRGESEVASLAGTKIGMERDMDVVKVRLSAVSADAVSRDRFPFTTVQSTLVYSACRDATVELSYKGTTPYVGTVRVPDPNFVQTVGLPRAGKIEFHDQCGVSVSHGKSVTASSTELLKAAIDQVRSIKDAQDKAAGKPAAAKPAGK